MIYIRITNEEPTPQTAAALIHELCYSNKDYLNAAFIIAGWDKYNGGSVYVIPLGGTLYRAPYTITGN